MTHSRESVLAAIGRTLPDGYRLVALLGEGAMGAVYRAERDGSPPVAVKILHEHLGSDAAQRERFEREARALFALAHPNILRVDSSGVTEGSPYLVMELLEGLSFDTFLEQHEPSPRQVRELLRQVLSGLAFAHARGVLHRDLKTENVFISRGPGGEWQAKLLDFGLVKFVDDEQWGAANKLTVMGSVFGTPAYMAPEQCAGAPVTAAADVYAAGVICFEAITLVWPFMEETRLAMFKAHLSAPVPRLEDAREGLGVDPALQTFIERALAKKPEDRFADAGAMLEAFVALPDPAAWLGAAPTAVRPTSAAPRLPLWPFVLGAVATLFVALAALALFVHW